MMLETRKVDNNKIRKAFFVYLRPLLCYRYALLRTGSEQSRGSECVV